MFLIMQDEVMISRGSDGLEDEEPKPLSLIFTFLERKVRSPNSVSPDRGETLPLHWNHLFLL